MEETLVLGGDKGLDKVRRDVIVSDVFAVGLVKEDADDTLSVIIIYGTLRKDDLFDNAALDTGGRLFGHAMIDKRQEAQDGEDTEKDKEAGNSYNLFFHSPSKIKIPDLSLGT